MCVAAFRQLAVVVEGVRYRAQMPVQPIHTIAELLPKATAARHLCRVTDSA